MVNEPKLPGHFAIDPQRSMLLPPEKFAEQPEDLTVQMFIERSLTENRFWVRIMKEHALFLGEGFSRNDKSLIQEADKFYMWFDQQLKQAHSIAETEQNVRQLNDNTIIGYTHFETSNEICCY